MAIPDSVLRIEHELLKVFQPVRLAQPQNQQQQEAIVTKSFNMTEDYCSHNVTSVREHIQNWVDQCKAGAVHSRYNTKTSAPATVTDATGMTKFQALLDDGTDKQRPSVALGYAAIHKHSNGGTSMVFKNFGTAMTIDHMSLGCSSKRNIAELAGKVIHLHDELVIDMPSVAHACMSRAQARVHG